jgi:hypothetical protein
VAEFSYFHITTNAATQPISVNSGVILGRVSINTAGVATVLTLFDAATVAQCTAANTVAIVTTTATQPAAYLDVSVVMSRGIFYTLTVSADITVSFR